VLDGLRIWLDGGWGIDALLGRQTREHSDLDVAIDAHDVGEAARRLSELGFAHDIGVEPGMPARYVLRDARGRQIDFHVLAFGAAGEGWQQLPDGARGRYPASGLMAVGSIGGTSVPCISADLQLRHHAGYAPTEGDVTDIALLRELLKSYEASAPQGF
jgi:lincosamide nucleotidyltransferase A/C/D/E